MQRAVSPPSLQLRLSTLRRWSRGPTEGPGLRHLDYGPSDTYTPAVASCVGRVSLLHSRCARQLDPTAALVKATSKHCAPVGIKVITVGGIGCLKSQST